MGLTISTMSQSFLGNRRLRSWADHIHLLTIIDRVIENQESVINLNNCNVSKLPEEFFMLTKSMEINLSHNQITDLSPEWTALHVQSLALDYNKLTTVPPVLKSCACLTWLNLGHNPLKTISPDIGEIKNLDTLWINGTEIEELPKEIAYLSVLETLGARRNNIKYFPKELCYLKNLSWLTLANNNIQTLPGEFCNLKSLIHLNISHNQLNEVPLVLSDLQELEYCYLSFNLITYITKETLMKMSHVKCLNLKGNEISNVSKEDLKLYKFALIDGCEWESKNNRDSESDSEDWESSMASSVLYFDMTDDDSDDQINNLDRVGQVMNKVAKFSVY